MRSVHRNYLEHHYRQHCPLRSCHLHWQDGGTLKTLVAFNNITAGFSSTTDAIIDFTGYSGSLSNLAVVRQFPDYIVVSLGPVETLYRARTGTAADDDSSK